MKKSIAPLGAILSVLGFLAWIFYAQADPSAADAEGARPASVFTLDDELFYRERTGGERNSLRGANRLAYRESRRVVRTESRRGEGGSEPSRNVLGGSR